MDTPNTILASWHEYQSLPSSEWRKDFFCPDTGGFVATHRFKTQDDLSIPGLAAEAKACHELAKQGKHVLRLPENIPELIDCITVNGKPYRELLKFKHGEVNPRGYPDAYFDEQTWDFKVSTSEKDDTIRQLIKDGRKADNLIFITEDEKYAVKIQHALEREIGRRKTDNTWIDLPDIYCLTKNRIRKIWMK